jgi:hypothetical protein
LQLLLTGGAGFGAGMDVGPFEAKASYVVTFLALFADHSWGVGMGVIIRASVDLVIIELETTFEARHMWMTTKCASGVTKWGLTQVSIAIDVHIFIVCDISFHDSAEGKSNHNNGPCPMEVAGLTEVVGKPT